MFHRAWLILCLAAVLVSAERGCPYPEDVEPCFCQSVDSDYSALTCTKVHDTEVLLRVFENNRRYHFNAFLLFNSTLQYIPHQIFDDVKVEFLSLKYNTFRNLFDEVPRNPGIRAIQVDGVKVLGGLDWKTLAVFKNLESLKIWDVPLRKLTADFRSNVSKKLSILYCKNCQIKQLEDNVFAEFTDLKSIKLPYNAIVDIKRTMFPRRNKLYAINLEYNKISTLPSDMFSDMPFLKMVELNGNMMAVLPEDTFQPIMSQITLLYVQSKRRD
ncbi:hypothetical protein JTE90_028418 [Oedothorax gibbosus]|uniref:Uncharacterized protein n=1 Tax=Oedothorax gibbosus TaxID=931172 RepID=A0AAV6VEX3_9ARAC|nr:hypothetical protein JTE90_028418 [Oedothorax gibbosus]